MSSVHVGAGQGVGAIDLPIIREKTTGWPFIPGSSVKGATREHYESGEASAEWIMAAYGNGREEGVGLAHDPEEAMKEGNAGSLVWSDSRILAFPVASMTGTFAYVSCPMALQRMQRDAEAAGITLPDIHFDKLLSRLEAEPGEPKPAVIAKQIRSELVNRPGQAEKIELDEFVFNVQREAALDHWLHFMGNQIFAKEESRNIFQSRFVIVSDEAFQYFTTLCCEVLPRIRIESETKTVSNGLWLEEYIPAEAILYGIVWCDRIYVPSSKLSRHDLLKELQSDFPLQIGGNASVGKGRVRFSFSKEGLQ